jgi:6-phosphogluconolactonase
MDHPLKPEICVFQDPDALAENAARLFAETAEHVTGRKGVFAVALSGGSTPRKLYRLLADTPDLPWSEIHVFWGDERCVPPDHEESNGGMAWRELLSRVPIPRRNIHAIPGKLGRQEADDHYFRTLLDFFGPLDTPAFDLVLLGMGADGHTASLFPGRFPDPPDSRWVIPATAPPEATVRHRVSLTLPVLNAAQRVWFLVTGEEKRPVVEAILGDPEGAGLKYPAGRVRPSGQLLWLLDAAAAGTLGRTS